MQTEMIEGRTDLGVTETALAVLLAPQELLQDELASGRLRPTGGTETPV